MKTLLSILMLAFFSVGTTHSQSYDAWVKSRGKTKPTEASKPEADKTAVEMPESGKKPTSKSASARTGASKAATNSKAIAAPMGTYTGTLPCADCKGIETELTVNGSPKGSDRTFTLKQTYLGKPAGKNIAVSSGKWFLAKGNKQDPNATVLQLIPQGRGELMYFLQVSDANLRLLDREQNEIKSKQNYNLQKQ